MSFVLNKIDKAEKLPDIWDDKAESYYQKKKFLAHTEKFNSCSQRYYLLYDDNVFAAGVSVYTIRLDLLTFVGIPSPVKMHVAGVPASVSSSGIVFDPNSDKDYASILLSMIAKIERGFFTALNLPYRFQIKNIASGKTLPSIEMHLPFRDFSEYNSSLRSDYRRRLNKIKVNLNKIKVTRSSCSIFDSRMYELYLNVFNKSSAKLEKLSLDFFKNLPEEFELSVFEFKDKVVAWHIVLQNKSKSYFFMGGQDYEYTSKFDGYFSMTVDILKRALERQSEYLDLGQTAEIPKLRLGGKLISKYMTAHHSNSALNFLLLRFAGLMDYNKTFPEHRVFSHGEL